MDSAKTKPEFSTSFFGINILMAFHWVALRGFANIDREDFPKLWNSNQHTYDAGI
jgi:hypothetical protein